jgi:hypothetical protein
LREATSVIAPQTLLEDARPTTNLAAETRPVSVLKGSSVLSGGVAG